MAKKSKSRTAARNGHLRMTHRFIAERLRPLSARAQVLFIHIASEVGWQREEGLEITNNAELMERVGASKRTFYRDRQELIDANLLVVRKSGHSTVYKVNLTAGGEFSGTHVLAQPGVNEMAHHDCARTLTPACQNVDATVPKRGLPSVLTGYEQTGCGGRKREEGKEASLQPASPAFATLPPTAASRPWVPPETKKEKNKSASGAGSRSGNRTGRAAGTGRTADTAASANTSPSDFSADTFASDDASLSAYRANPADTSLSDFMADTTASEDTNLPAGVDCQDVFQRCAEAMSDAQLGISDLYQRVGFDSRTGFPIQEYSTTVMPESGWDIYNIWLRLHLNSGRIIPDKPGPYLLEAVARAFSALQYSSAHCIAMTIRTFLSANPKQRGWKHRNHGFFNFSFHVRELLEEVNEQARQAEIANYQVEHRVFG